jgi:hypothetical protein
VSEVIKQPDEMCACGNPAGKTWGVNAELEKVLLVGGPDKNQRSFSKIRSNSPLR